jgi:predicted O-methyltransferase YrrM
MDSQKQWDAVDHYLCDLLIPHDSAVAAAVKAAEEAGLPQIAVSPPLGKLLHLLARLAGARHILEIGTLAGYSTIWLARALREGGRVITLEYDPKHAEIARANFARAGLADRIELRLGKAIETLPKIAAEQHEPFDLVFIDADKVSTPDYLTWAMKLTRPGSVIVIDNVVREGKIADKASKDVSVKGIQTALEMLAKDKRVTTTAFQMVGTKGYDGIAIAMVI